MNRLRGMRTYTCGAMDRVPDGGVEWRKRITPMLNDMGIIVMDPCVKPYEGAVEDSQQRESRQKEKKAGNLDAVARIMRPIRRMDLKMVDSSDFLIASIDVTVHAVGTYEEISWANRQKKPVLCWVHQGRNETPDWLLGMLPTKHFFSSLDELFKYLKFVDVAKNPGKRWYTPRFHMLYNPDVLNLKGV